ncbi:MAG: DNA-processing protein DprA [Cyanobacteria bacterium HKST-UBA04]|nr:DNA-processing protein DprA [Cyanobacteria bacterium HKST-UBA04]
MVLQIQSDTLPALDRIALFSGEGDATPTVEVPTEGTATVDDDTPDPHDQLSAEFNALQQPAKHIALIGSRNISLPHQQLIEAMAYMLVKEGNTIITSGGSSGTNAAAIRGAMRANPKKLQVILPQTIGHQPSDVQDQLIGIPNIHEHAEWNMLTLADASRLCNREIIDEAQQLLIFLTHSSNTLIKAIEYAEERHKIVTAFFLD